MKVRLALFVALTIGVAALAAPAGASVGSTKNGCKYLKKGEVSTAIGHPVKKADKPAGPPQTRVCGYTATDAAGISVNLWVDDSDSAKREYASFRKVFGDESEPVPELGKKAFYATSVGTVYVLESGTLTYVQYVKFPVDDPAAVKAAVIDMTEIVLNRV